MEDEEKVEEVSSGEQETVEKKSSKLPLIIIVVCIIAIVLIITKPWAKDEPVEETPTEDNTVQPAPPSDFETAVEGDIVTD